MPQKLAAPRNGVGPITPGENARRVHFFSGDVGRSMFATVSFNSDNVATVAKLPGLVRRGCGFNDNCV